MLDACVIGGGPAGLAAATWLARYRRSVCLLDAGEHRNRFAEHAHGYVGFDPCRPLDLIERGTEHLERYEQAEVRHDAATRVERDGDAFLVHTGSDPIRARRLVLATGVRDVFPDVRNFFEHYGTDVFHCPACDAYEMRDRRVVVFGWSRDVAGFALTLTTWAKSVAVVTDGNRFEGDDEQRTSLEREGIVLVQDEAVELAGTRGHLEGIVMRSGARIDCDAAFFTIAHVPQVELATSLGCRLDAEGYIAVDETGCTSVPGVYAAGDCVPGLQLIQVAAAKGTIAGIGCALSLLA